MQGGNGLALVIGGGIAGLAAALRLAERGIKVSIISLNHVRRSHSVCAQGGINAAIDSKSEGDSPEIHAYDTIKGGDFLAEQPPVLEMCMVAPKVIHMLERLGCPFNRTDEGGLDVRRFGGTTYHRTLFCGSSTGQQIVHTLDSQISKHEELGNITKYEHHEFLRLILDGDRKTRGVVVMDIFSLDIFPIYANAVVVATGGIGVLFKNSTNSTESTGAAVGRLYKQGVYYANGEFIQIHPTAIATEDKRRLVSESVRGEGGRFWVYGDSSKSILTPDGRMIPCGKDGEPWYFFEELYPEFKNLVPRDISSREIFKIFSLGLGIDGRDEVFLDIKGLSRDRVATLKSVLDIYQKFTGEDPLTVPMRVAPAAHYSMGGAWVDWPAADAVDRWSRFRQMANIPGCFVAGEAEYQYHGANRLGANSMLACAIAGLTCGDEISRYLASVDFAKGAINGEENVQIELDRKKKLFGNCGGEDVNRLHEELSALLTKALLSSRDNVHLQNTFDAVKCLKHRSEHITLKDHTSNLLNQTYLFANRFCAMVELALVIVKSALLRDESRGAHYKEKFPNRDDEKWLKTTMAFYSDSGPEIFYKEVDTPYLSPDKRDYSRSDTGVKSLSNIPSQITLTLP